MPLDTPPSRVGGPLTARSTASGHRRPRSWRIAAPVVAVVALALAAAACAPPGSPGTATGDVANAINQDRGAAGLGGLAWDDQLSGLAQSHANELAAAGALWHSDLGAWLGLPWMGAWRSLGENLLQAPPGTSSSSAEDMWMASPPHRANILNGGFNRVGVGVATDGAGQVWMVALFGTR